MPELHKRSDFGSLCFAVLNQNILLPARASGAGWNGLLPVQLNELGGCAVVTYLECVTIIGSQFDAKVRQGNQKGKLVCGSELIGTVTFG